MKSIKQTSLIRLHSQRGVISTIQSGCEELTQEGGWLSWCLLMFMLIVWITYLSSVLRLSLLSHSLSLPANSSIEKSESVSVSRFEPFPVQQEVELRWLKNTECDFKASIINIVFVTMNQSIHIDELADESHLHPDTQEFNVPESVTWTQNDLWPLIYKISFWMFRQTWTMWVRNSGGVSFTRQMDNPKTNIMCADVTIAWSRKE